MLVLSRKKEEVIIIGGGASGQPEIRLMVVGIRGDKVQIGLDAPKEVPVHRQEVYQAIQRQNAAKLAGQTTAAAEGDGPQEAQEKDGA